MVGFAMQILADVMDRPCGGEENRLSICNKTFSKNNQMRVWCFQWCHAVAPKLIKQPRSIPMLQRFSAALLLMCLLVALSVAPKPLSAQDDQKDALIRELLEVTGAFAIADQMIDATSQNMATQVKTLRPDIPSEAIDMIFEEVRRTFAASRDEFATAMVAIYGRHFTSDEISDLLAFYQTPTGRKLVQAQPQIVQDSLAIGQQWGLAVGQEAVQNVRRRLQKEGYDL